MAKKRANYQYTVNLDLGNSVLPVNVYVNNRLKKSLKLYWTENKELDIAVPSFFTRRNLSDFLNKKKHSLIKTYEKQAHLRYLRSFSVEEEKIERERLRAEATQFYSDFPAKLYNSRPKQIQIRKQKTRWGSCSSSGTISLNVYLRQLPEELRQYVFIHELVHMEHPHHQKSFWAEMERLCPGAKSKRAQLQLYVLPT